MNRIYSLVSKDVKLLLRDRVGFFFTFFFPLVYCIFFGAIFSSAASGKTEPIKIVVVDEDATPESAAFVETLRNTPEFSIELGTVDDAANLVRRGKRMAYILLPKGFGEQKDGMFWGEPPTVQVGIDPSRGAEAAMLKGLLAKCSFEGMREMFSDPSVMQKRVDGWLKGINDAEDMDPTARTALRLFLPALASFGKQFGGQSTETESGGMTFEPLRIESVPVARNRLLPNNAYQVSFPQGIIWGVLGCSVAFALSLVTERTKGTLVRLRMSPIPSWQILGGKAGACLMTNVLLMSALFGVGAIAFGVIPGSIAMLALAVCSISIAFVGIMMLLSVLGRTEQAAAGIAWAILMVMAMTGGGMIPLVFMPSWMKAISDASPVKWAILAMEGAVWREFDLGEMLTPCAILIGVGVVCFVVGTRAFRWTEDT